MASGRQQPGGAKGRVRAIALAGLGGAAGLRDRAALADLFAGAAARLRRWLVEEIDERRLFLWTPVCFGLGVLAYFAADREPALWAPALATTALALGAWRARRADHMTLARTLGAFAFVFAGFLAGTARTAWVAAPVIERPLVGLVVAYVETVELRGAGARLLLRPASIAGLPAGQTPRRIRVTMRWAPDFVAGAAIAAPMRLLPPPRPSEPGGYDFSREAWFAGVGAVGSLSSPPRAAPAIDAPLIARVNAFVDRGRNALTARIIEVIGDRGAGVGAVAAALITGKRGQIPENVNDDLRGAGIYHVVSISGLHMVLAAGLFLWSLRAVLALFPALALRYPIKTWAALFAMAGAIAYDVFAGSEVATERSLIMTLAMLGAVALGRPAFSMRNLALAALLVLALEPQALIGPSFQMSFAAVAAMIAAFERREGAPGPTPDTLAKPKKETVQEAAPGLAQRARLVLGVMAATTLVASIATDPYATFHFHRVTPYGLLGNMLTLPLVEFIVMPAALFGVVAAPFGLDAPVWWLMGQGVGFVVSMAHWVAALPGSTVFTPAFGAGALLLMSFGLLWLCLWRTPLRWAGPAIALAGVALAGQAPRPDLQIDRQGRTVAVRNAQGTLDILNARANPFGASQWLSADADRRRPDAPGLAGAARCDRQGCVTRLRDGRVLALVLDRAALPHDCARADIVVTPVYAEGLCKGPEKLIDGAHLARHGATDMTLAPDGALTLVTARAPHYDRPWSPAPKPAPARAARRTAGDPAQAGANANANANANIPPSSDEAGWSAPAPSSDGRSSGGKAPNEGQAPSERSPDSAADDDLP